MCACFQVMAQTMRKTQRRQAELGQPVQRIRYFGATKAGQELLRPRLDEHTLPPDTSMAERLKERMKEVIYKPLPSTSPTPLYPWSMPATPASDFRDADVPLHDVTDVDFASKVLSMVTRGGKVQHKEDPTQYVAQ